MVVVTTRFIVQNNADGNTEKNAKNESQICQPRVQYSLTISIKYNEKAPSFILEVGGLLETELTHCEQRNPGETCKLITFHGPENGGFQENHQPESQWGTASEVSNQGLDIFFFWGIGYQTQYM